MFEVGVKEAGNQLSDLEKRLKELVAKYGAMKIAVEIGNLDTFVNALKSIGNGEQLKPLLDRIQTLQNRLGALGDKGQYFDMLRANAAAAAKEVERAEKYLQVMDKTGNVNLKASAKEDLRRAQVEATRANEMLASATERFAKEEERVARETNNTKAQIDALGASVTELHAKLGSGININFDTSKFSTWAAEVQGVSSAVKELVGQLQKMHEKVSDNSSIKTQNDQLIEQARVVEELRLKLHKLYGEGLKTPKTENSYKAIEGVKQLEPQLSTEQAKFNEMLAQGATLANSYAQVIQSLGQKYNHTAEQAQKLAYLIANDSLNVSNVQRGLRVGYNQATEIVQTIEALRKLHQEEIKPAPQGGLFDPQRFTSLQEAIDKIISEINRLKEAFSGIGKIEGLSQMTTDINGLMHNVNNLKDVLSTLSSAVKIDQSSPLIKKLTADAEAAEKKIQELTEKLNAMSAAQNKVAESVAKSGKSETQVTDSQMAIFNRYKKLMADIHNIKREIVDIQRSDGGGGALGAQLGQYFSALNRVRNEIAKITSAPSLAEAISRGMSSEMLSKFSSSLAAIKSEFKEVVSGAKAFNKEFDKGSAKSEAAIRKMGMAFNELKTYMKKNGGSEEMRKLQSEIQVAIQKMRQLMNAGDYSGAIRVFERMSGAIRQASTAMKEYDRSIRRAMSSTSELSDSEQRLADAIRSGTNAMKGQSQVLNDLKMLATQYLSVWGAQSFIHNIIEVGGQLEKQRLSIGAILGDISQANDLFGKIKNLAIKSPFGVVELDQFTKQLSAYGFKYNELYDMTKRLADIAAGAGTDVSRLTLAIGHVRAEGALTGYTLRQFAMNNIPMVSELAKKLSEVEHRIVTVADVRKRVSKKEIGYQDVIDVIENLTNEGGMFYNMQETISQSIQSRFKNLRDSLDIMYGEIAESGIGDALKSVAIGLTEMSRNWKAFIPIVQSATISFVAYKTAMMATNMVIGKNNMAVTASILAYKKRRAEELTQEAMVRKLTAEEERLIQTHRKLTAENIRVAMSVGVMTKGEALKLVALRKVDLETTKALIHMGMFSAAEARMALNGRLLWMNLGKVGASIKLFGSSAWSSLKNLAGGIFTPLNAAFAALTIGMSANQRQNEFDELREQRRKAMNEMANEGYKNLMEARKNFEVGNSINMTKTDINLSLDDMMDKLREYSKLYNTTFNEAFKVDETGHAVHNLAEQYEILAQGIENATNAHKMFGEMRDLVSHALETSDPNNGFWKNVGDVMYGWLLDDSEKAKVGSLSDSLEHYAESVRQAGLAENLLMRDHLALRRAMEGRGLGDVMNMTNDELMQTLSRLRNTMPDVFTAIRLSLSAESREMLDDWTAKCNEMNDAYASANLKMRKAGDDLYKSLSTKFGDDMTQWPAEWREFVFLAMDAATKDVKGFSDMSIEYQNLVRDSFLHPFKISVDSDEAKEKVNDLYVDLQNLVGKTWTIKIGVKGESAWEDLETSGKKYQDADKKVKQLEQNLKRLGFAPGKVPILASRQALKVAEEYNDAIAERRAARLVYESYGGDVSEFNKDKKTKTPKKKGSGEDQEAKRLREIAKLYKDAYDWYLKYEKQIGESGALKKTKEQFQPLFDEFNKTWKTDLSLDSIPKYKENVTSLLDEAMKLYQTPAHKNNHMVDAIKVLRDAISNVDFQELGNEQDEFLSKTKIQLDNLTRSWETFNSVRDATGNIELAVQLSGAGYQAGTNVNLADDLRKKIEGDFAAAGAIAIPFDINFSDEEIFNRISAAMPEKTQEQIKGIVEEYKKWRDLQRDIYKQGITTISQLLGSAQDYETVARKINTSLAAQKEAIDSMEKPDGMSDDEWAAVKARAKALADAKAQNDIFKRSTEYINLMNHSLGMTSESIRTAAEACKNELGKNLKDNIIKAQQYAEEMAKIEKIMSDFKANGLFGRNSDLNSFIKGGTQGLISRYTDQLAARRTELANQGKSKEEIENDEVVKRLQKLRSALEDFANGLNSIASYIDFATNILQGFGDAAKNLSDMFDALGDESSANTWSDISDSIGAVTSGLQSLSSGAKAGANGDIGGVISGVVGAVTSPITAFAQLHDKGIQREIEALQDNVEALELNTEAIRKARSRMFGYDDGSVRRLMASLYSDTSKRNVFLSSMTGREIYTESAGKKAMQEYYNAGTNKTGYAAELENLKEMRQNYLEMYDKEEDKKKSSQDALDDYKKKIAELDEQIMYFVEDLANELWGIDFKAWASQISDALWTAFENGESALDAFHDAARDIISDVAKRMMNIHLIEPVFQQLEEQLFGKMENGKRVGGAAYNYDTGEFNEKETLKILGKFFGENGEFAKVIDSAEDFYNMAKTASGLDFGEDSTGSRSSSAISKAITEEQSNLLIALANTIRADVSVNRTMIAQYFPMFHAAITSGNASLVNIENHTAAIMRSNETIANGITEMQSDIRGLKNKAWRVPVS